MKKGNVTILASVFTMLIVAMGVGAGTMAWFSQSENVAITMTSGNVDLQLSKNNQDWYNGLSFNFPVGWAPGDSFEVHVYLRNMGTSGSKTVWVYGSDLSDAVGLSNRIFIKDAAYTDSSAYGTWETGYTGYWVHPSGGLFYETGAIDSKYIFGNGAAPLTLYEFCTSRTETTHGYMRFYWGHWYEEDYLKAEGANVQQIRLKFYFDETADNEYQNKVCGFNIVFLATDNQGYGLIWPVP